MKTELLNQQARVNLDPPKVIRLLQWLAQRVEAMEPGTTWENLSLVVLDDEGMTGLNRRYFGKDRPTDVISFRYPPAPGAEAGATGEVFVNAERAVTEGPDFRGADYELALYAAHGCLHLCGADDAEPGEADAMRRTQESWLDDAAADGLLTNLGVERHIDHE